MNDEAGILCIMQCRGCSAPLPKGHTEFCSRRCRHDTLPRRFWERVDQSGGPAACWPWTGTNQHKKGYGRLRVNGRAEYSHRFALLLTKGVPPDDDHLLAIHSCGNPPCCNPAHLRWGAPADNAEDMIVHGTVQRHLSNPKAKDLTGRRFGRLVVEAVAVSRNSRLFWQCRCDCGNRPTAHTSALLRGEVVSCGCRRRDAARERMLSAANPIHGDRRRR